MEELFTFDDVLIKPKYSLISSRKDVDISTEFLGKYLQIPVLSSNMKSITEVKMAEAMHMYGGLAVHHRFNTIDENVTQFNYFKNSAVSVGVGDEELDRAKELYKNGAIMFFLDVANGAQLQVVEQYVSLREYLGNDGKIAVGNFATGESIIDFINEIRNMTAYEGHLPFPDAIKVGIGPGAACLTRVKTGCGIPQLSAIQDCARVCRTKGIKVIADGGIRSPGDVAKAIGAGADVVMVGSMLSGTDEVPFHSYNVYAGSASDNKETYKTSEGDSFKVPSKGSVKDILKDIEGGLRSALTYVGAYNLEQFKEKVTFVKVSNATITENGAHGKNV